MKTSWISGSLAMAAKQCEMMGWPATSKSGYIVSTICHRVVASMTSRMSIPWGGPGREDGNGFLVRVHRPARFSRVFFCIQHIAQAFHTRITAFVIGAPPLAPRMGTCRLAMFRVVKLSRAALIFVAVYVDSLEGCRSTLGVSVLRSVVYPEL